MFEQCRRGRNKSWTDRLTFVVVMSYIVLVGVCTFGMRGTISTKLSRYAPYFSSIPTGGNEMGGIFKTCENGL